MESDSNCITFWLPKLEAAGVRVPETRIVRAEAERDPVTMLDGELPKDWLSFVMELGEACAAVGFPAFLRTGHGSGKHMWRKTCFVQRGDDIGMHIRELVEWSHVVSPFGLPTHVWAARRMIETDPLFRMAAWDEFPVTREFRFFVFDGEVVHWQPYWPPAAIEEPILTGQPTPPDWREKLERASDIDASELVTLTNLAKDVSRAVPGYWSVDFLQDRHRNWWVTDMAMGEASFKYDPATGAEITGRNESEVEVRRDKYDERLDG
jgi:hypothetical protein